MDKQFSESVEYLIRFFYHDLYQKIYLDEIHNITTEYDVLPVGSEELSKNIALIWALAYYFMPILTHYRNEPQFDIAINAIADTTQVNAETIIKNHTNAEKSLLSGQFGAYRYYWQLFNEIDNNEIPPGKDPFVAPLFTTISSQLIDYGKNSLVGLLQSE